MRRIGRAEREGVGSQSALCLAPCSSRVRVGLILAGGEHSLRGLTRCTQDVAVALLGRRVERPGTRQVSSVTDDGKGYRAAEGSTEWSACVPGQSCRSDGLGFHGWLLALGRTDCTAAPRYRSKWLVVFVCVPRRCYMRRFLWYDGQVSRPTQWAMEKNKSKMERGGGAALDSRFSSQMAG
jgi:hypothetical protein